MLLTEIQAGCVACPLNLDRKCRASGCMAWRM